MMQPPVATQRKKDWEHLYSIVGDSAVQEVLLRTETYDRIGPITLPLRTVGRGILDYTVYYYGFYATGNSYFLITRSSELVFNFPLLRVSSNCNWAFDFDSVRCECDWEFQHAKAKVSEQANDDGLIIFAVDQHGKSVPGGTRGHALIYALGQAQRQDLVYDAYAKNGFEVDYRSYDEIFVILRAVGIDRIRLLTNNPERVEIFAQHGFNIQREAIEKPYEVYDSEELGVKRERLHHYLTLDRFSRDDIRIYGLDPERAFDT
jgi:GTP cyclohydrolase II